MRKLVLSLIGASALAISSAASAVVILPGAPGPVVGGVLTQPGRTFQTTPDPVLPTYTGPITATIGHTGITAGPFSDTFLFTIGTLGMGPIGTGSGAVTTSATVFFGSDDLDITSVVFNNGLTDFLATLTLYDRNNAICGHTNADRGGPNGCGISESYALTGVPITGGLLNSLTVSGLSHGTASYGGSLSFTPTGVPEPATWAMMLLGFAGIGFQLRRSRRRAALPQFA